MKKVLVYIHFGCLWIWQGMAVNSIFYDFTDVDHRILIPLSFIFGPMPFVGNIFGAFYIDRYTELNSTYSLTYIILTFPISLTVWHDAQCRRAFKELTSLIKNIIKKES